MHPSKNKASCKRSGGRFLLLLFFTAGAKKRSPGKRIAAEHMRPAACIPPCRGSFQHPPLTIGVDFLAAILLADFIEGFLAALGFVLLSAVVPRNFF